ncbi:hypothetical protein R3P38DRAFT_3354908 [Favolaschia claudopus]|uniref:Uncharacterized protein n=1 Tax=Favolaschia claudopus TaxID=2862362 RepID=A0AAW0BL03_9AGAR
MACSSVTIAATAEDTITSSSESDRSGKVSGSWQRCRFLFYLDNCKKDGSCDETTQCSCTDGPNWYSNLVNSNEAPAPLLQIGSQTGIEAPSRSQLSGEGHIGYHKQLSERQMQGEGDGAEPPVGTRQPHMRMPARQILDLGRSDGRRGQECLLPMEYFGGRPAQVARHSHSGLTLCRPSFWRVTQLSLGQFLAFGLSLGSIPAVIVVMTSKQVLFARRLLETLVIHSNHAFK